MHSDKTVTITFPDNGYQLSLREANLPRNLRSVRHIPKTQPDKILEIAAKTGGTVYTKPFFTEKEIYDAHSRMNNRLKNLGLSDTLKVEEQELNVGKRLKISPISPQ